MQKKIDPALASKIIDSYNDRYLGSANYRSNIKKLLSPTNIDLIQQGKVPQDVFAEQPESPEETQPQPKEQGSALGAYGLLALPNRFNPANILSKIIPWWKKRKLKLS